MIKLFSATIIFVQFSYASIPYDDEQLVRDRIVAEMLKNQVNDERIRLLLKTISEAGSWSSINYRDFSPTGFQHARHTQNLVWMGIAYRQANSRYHNSTALKEAIIQALQFWVKNDFVADNWWHNQIGTPDALSDLMLLVGDELPPDLVSKSQPIIHKGNLNASGARPSGDRIKIAEISAKQFLFLKDNVAFNETVKVIESEIKFEKGKGLQYDYSFHHREDNVNNTLTYGLQFANVFANWSYYLKGTKYAFSADKIKILIDYYLDGICKMMVFEKYPDVGVKNRDLSRAGAIEAVGTISVEKLLAVSDYRSQELWAVIRARENDSIPKFSWSKFFWRSEYYSHQQPGFFSSVRLHSTRNANIEYPYNGEGLLNHHLGDGANYVYTNGREYDNIFPVWDWQKIPGTTIMQKPALDTGRNVQKPGLTNWVGGITDGIFGAAAFDFKSPHDGTLAKKAWFFFNDLYVCLGTGIYADSTYPVVTTLNQCLLNGQVTVMQGINKTVESKGTRLLQKTQWVHHDKVGYYFPKATDVVLSNQQQSGSWYQITHQLSASKKPVSLDVFKLWINHGPHPKAGTYAYFVVPGVSVLQFENIIKEKSVRVIENTKDIQAVYHKKSGMLQAFFYKPANLNFDRIHLKANTPLALMLQIQKGVITKITVADPGRNLTETSFSISVRISPKVKSANIRWDQKSKSSNIEVKMPTDVYAGESVTLSLKQ